MLALIWSALTSRIAGPIATAVAVALACFLAATLISNASLKGKVARQGVQIANLQVDLRQCQHNRVTLEASIARQNEAVEAMKAEGDRMTRAAEKAVRDAQAVAESHRKRADRFASARPQTCADVSDLIDGAAR